MTKNLKEFKFTKKADRAISKKGWVLGEMVVVNALAGNDTIKSTGIDNKGTINTGAGNDTIKGTRTGIDNEGTINTGAGNDTITGSGYSGISNDGINNSDTIYTGEGNDIITGIGSNTGIENSDMINTGAGDDTITGTGSDSGIYNEYDCTIYTGEGNDIVNALTGGFDGDGKTYLGFGNDTLKGFGAGSFYGGTDTDKILFGEGTYEISTSYDRITYDEISDSYAYEIGDSYVVSNGVRGVEMYIFEFEQIGGANGGLFTFIDGTLTVDSAGIATFA